jgi:hypothetical protein
VEALRVQLLNCPLVPLAIAFDLGTPKLRMNFWEVPARWTAVPETAIDKDDQFVQAKAEIRPARKVLRV